MGDPAPSAVMHTRRLCARLGELFDHREKRLHALAEICRFGRPVVHLRVDVDRVLAAPRRGERVIPQTLQVCRLGARPRARGEQVSPVLEVKRGERGILGDRAGLHSLVGGSRGGVAGAEIESNATEEAPVLGDVMGLQRLEALPSHPDHLPGRRRGVSGDVPAVPVAGRGRDQNDHRIGAPDRDDAALRRRRPTRRDHLGAHLEGEGACDPVGRSVGAAQDQGRIALEGDRRTLGRAQRHVDSDPPAGVGGQPESDDLVHRRREDLAHVRYAVRREARPRDCRVEVELALVRGDRSECAARDLQLASGGIGHLPDGTRHHPRLGQVIGLAVLAFEDESAHERKRREGLGAVGVVRAAGPERVLVELERLGFDAAEDHRPQAAGADGQRLGPLPGGLPVPQA